MCWVLAAGFRDANVTRKGTDPRALAICRNKKTCANQTVCFIFESMMSTTLIVAAFPALTGILLARILLRTKLRPLLRRAR